MTTLLPRYARTSVLGQASQYGTSYTIPVVRSAVASGNVRVDRIVLEGLERLDTLAGKYYGDGRLWWVIAAASGIGWAPQVPPGTILLIPNLEDLSKYAG